MFRDVLYFKEGFWIGILTWAVIWLGIVFVIGSIVDSYEMEKQHCVKTEKSRDVDYTYNILVGKVPVIQHGIRTEYLYICDDESRWR